MDNSTATYIGLRSIGQRLGVGPNTARRRILHRGLPAYLAGRNRGRPIYRISEPMVILWELQQAELAAQQRAQIARSKPGKPKGATTGRRPREAARNSREKAVPPPPAVCPHCGGAL